MLKVIGGVPDGEYKAIASGTLPNGKPVVVNADGTVSVVGTIAGDNIGSFTSFTSNSTAEMSGAFDSTNNKVVIVYKDNTNSQYGTAAVGTVSGSSISFGTPVVFEAAIMGNVTSTAFDANAGKVVIAYKDEGNSFYGTAIVGTVSGTSISFGTAVVFSSVLTSNTNVVYDSTNNKMVFSYSVSGPNGKARVGTVSGTSISFGTEATFNSGNSGPISSTFDSTNGKVVIVFRDGGNSDYGTAVVGTVSGTSISFGSEAVFSSATTNQHAASFDANAGKILIAYQDGNSSNQGKVVVGTVSGTSISYGTAANLNPSGEGEKFSATYDSSAQKVRILYLDKGDSNKAKLGTCTISGTSVSVSNFEVGSSLTGAGPAVYDSAQDKTVLSFTTRSPSFVFGTTSANLTAENYIGMSSGVAIPGALDTTEFQDSNTTQYVSSVYDVNAERVVIAYLNNDTSSGTGGCIVGEINGANITFGSFTTFSTGTQISDISLTYDSTNNKFVFSYQFSNNTVQSKVATVDPSDNSITFGSAAQYSSEADQITSIFDDSSGKVVLAFRSRETATEFDILARVGTVSGTSISWGTAVTVSSVSSQWVSLGNDVDSNKIVFAYLASSEGKSKVGTVSGTTISFGSEATFTTNATYISSMAYHDALDKMILTYRDSGNSNYPTSVVGTVSGTSISFGTPVVLNSAYGGTAKRASAYDPVNQKVFTVYGPTGGSVIQDLTASGTTLVKGTTTALGHEAAFQCLTYISSLEKMLITYRGTDNDGYATLFAPEERGEVADGNPARTDIIGSVSTNQSGLTAGEKYYVQTDGTISTTAGSPSVLAGTAISATKLVVKT